jgi:hypothetical protein
MKLFKKILIVLAIGLVPIIACDTDALIELNDNPHAVQTTDWRYLLSSAQVDMAENRYVNWKTGQLMSAHLIQHLASSRSADRYTEGSTDIDFEPGWWDYVYVAAAKQLGEIRRQCGPDGSNPLWTNTYNVARIMYAYCMHTMTDFYGNICYFDAHRGIEGEEFFLPAYDNQQDVYEREGIAEGEVRGGILWELDDAASKLQTAGIDDLSKSDIIYGGDRTKWRKAAYSLMLRAAMRIYEKDPAFATTYINKAIAGGLMTSNADNFWIQMATGPSDWHNVNGYTRGMRPGQGGEGHGSMRPSETLIDFMKDNNDPRLMIISGGVGTWNDCIADLPACDKDPANQIGRPNGYDNGDDDPAVSPGAGIEWWCAQDPDCSAKWDGVSAIDSDLFFSCLNPWLLDLDEPHVFMTYAEVELLLAEIAERGIATTPKSAAQHYADGVRAAIHRWVLHDASFAVADAAIDAYLLEPNIAYTPGTAGLEQIAWQYWMATFMSSNHWETWFNWRRTGRPTLTLITWWDQQIAPEPHRRFRYSLTDKSINADNFAANATLPDVQTTLVWWDLGYNGAGKGQTN